MTSLIPWSLITAQFINLAFIGFLGFYFLRKRIPLFFKGRRDFFLKQLQESKRLRIEAEESRNKMKNLLKGVQSSYESDLKKAEVNAEKKKENLIAETHEIAESLKKKVREKVKKEEEKILKNLKQKLLSESFKKARKELNSTLTKEDQRHLEESIFKRFS